MPTQCTPTQLQFHGLGRRNVIGRFVGGRITIDASRVLLRKPDLRLGVLDRLARYVSDYRNRNCVEHSVRASVAQRIYAMALGYEDLNDHEPMRGDSLLASLVGKADLKGTDRVRARKRNSPLATASTLNRIELDATDGPLQGHQKGQFFQAVSGRDGGRGNDRLSAGCLST